MLIITLNANNNAHNNPQNSDNLFPVHALSRCDLNGVVGYVVVDPFALLM